MGYAACSVKKEGLRNEKECCMNVDSVDDVVLNLKCHLSMSDLPSRTPFLCTMTSNISILCMAILSPCINILEHFSQYSANS